MKDAKNIIYKLKFSLHNVIYYMDKGILLGTKTLVYPGVEWRIFRMSRLGVTTGGDITFPAFFIVVVLKIQMVFGSYLKRN